jgi:hypothetical protein
MLNQVFFQLMGQGETGVSGGRESACSENGEKFSSLVAALADGSLDIKEFIENQKAWCGSGPESPGQLISMLKALVHGENSGSFPLEDCSCDEAEMMEFLSESGNLPAEAGEDTSLVGAFFRPLQSEVPTALYPGQEVKGAVENIKAEGGLTDDLRRGWAHASAGANSQMDVLQGRSSAEDHGLFTGRGEEKGSVPAQTKTGDLLESGTTSEGFRRIPAGNGDSLASMLKTAGNEPGEKPVFSTGLEGRGLQTSAKDSSEGRAGNGDREQALKGFFQLAEARSGTAPDASKAGPEAFDHHLQGGQGSKASEDIREPMKADSARESAGAGSGTRADEEAKAGRTARLVAGAILKSRGESRSMEIQMKPEVLGRLRIELSINGKQADVKMITEGIAAKEAIEQSMNQIRADLQRQGVDLQKCEVQLGGSFSSGGEASGGKAKDRRGAGNKAQAVVSRDYKPSVNSIDVPNGVETKTAGTASGRVDFFA